MEKTSARSVDEYLARVASDDARASLTKLRATIRALAPNAEEVISYGMPAFKLNRVFIWFGAFKNHCSLFAGHTVGDFAEELKGYKLSTGTILFPHDKPPPDALVRSIIKARMAEDLAHAPSTGKV